MKKTSKPELCRYRLGRWVDWAGGRLAGRGGSRSGLLGRRIALRVGARAHLGLLLTKQWHLRLVNTRLLHSSTTPLKYANEGCKLGDVTDLTAEFGTDSEPRDPSHVIL